MSEQTQEKSTLTTGQKVLKALGVKGDFKTTVVPMMNYSCANISTSGAGYVISLYFSIFLTDVVNLSLSQAGIVSMLAIVWDAITDPLMGIFTDRTRSKYGKHRRYILWGAPLFCLSYAMMWNSYGIDGAARPMQAVAYYTIAYMLYKTAYTIIDVPHVAMLPELAPEYDLRTQYNSVGYLFNSLGMFPSFLFAMIIFSLYGFGDDLTSEAKAPMLVIGCSLGIIYALFLVHTFRKTREKPSLDLKLEKFDFHYFIEEYVYVFKNKAFREYFFMSLAYNIANNFHNNSLVYYIKYLANLYKYYGLFTTVSGIFEAAAFPFNYAVTIKQGKKKCGNIVTPLMIIGFAMCLFMPSGNKSTTALGFIFLMLTAVFYPFGKSGLGYVSTNILPDVTDVDEMITGRRREGVISTFNTFIKKGISGFMSAVVMFVLDFFGLVTGDAVKEYEASSGMMYQQTEQAIFGVRLCVAIIPIVFALISLFLLHRFKMNKKEHTIICAAIATKHKYGTVTLTDEEIKIMEDISGQKYENTWLGKNNNPEEYRPLEKNADGEFIILLEKEAEMAAIRTGKKNEETAKEAE